MKKYPYMTKTSTIKSLLEKIPQLGIPQKVTQTFLASLNYKSTNDRPAIKILKDLGFLDGACVPTALYKEYRDKGRSRNVLGIAVRNLYSDIFQIYTNANNLDQTTLENYFNTQSGLGQSAVKAMVDTFRVLCDLSSFDTDSSTDENYSSVESSPKEEKLENRQVQSAEVLLSENRKAKLIVPNDLTDSDIQKLKKVLEALR